MPIKQWLTEETGPACASARASACSGGQPSAMVVSFTLPASHMIGDMLRWHCRARYRLGRTLLVLGARLDLFFGSADKNYCSFYLPVCFCSPINLRTLQKIAYFVYLIGVGEQRSSGLLSGLLGGLLVIYATVILAGFRLAITACQELWAGPLIGTADGILTGMTGSFVVPGVMFLQAIGLPRDMLV